MNPTTTAALNGKWTYRSFRNEPIVVKDGKVEGDPQLAIPWAPPGVLDVSTDCEGVVTGTLTFETPIGPKKLQVTGRIVPATGKALASLDVTGEGESSVNTIKGFFIPGSDCVVGTVLCLANDLARQPVGTEGPFVLTPAKG
jgi:hypothetical protein